jgi:putative glutamine amidotransferase
MSQEEKARPRVGVPWRMAAEEAANRRNKIDNYLHAVERAGGDAVLLSLASSPTNLRRQIEELDAFVLTGSPADLDPGHYHAKRHPTTADPDAARERTDFALIEYGLKASKPILAICYGIQTLNVFLGGSLIQDIPSEIGLTICHSPDEEEFPSGEECPDAFHGVRFDPGRVMKLCGSAQAGINSWHHQAVREVGRGLRVTAHAPDGVIEAVEWVEDSNWILGVQWHPERMRADPLAEALFRDLVVAASQNVAAG